MRKPILGLSIITAFFILASSAVAQSGALKAYGIVVDQVLKGDTAGKKIYCSSNLTTPGMTVEGWRKSLTLPNSTGYLCFVDDMPDANWEHPARLIFVDSSNWTYQVYDMKTPPKNFSDFEQMGEYIPKARTPMLKAMKFNMNLSNEPTQASNAPEFSENSGAILSNSAAGTLLNLGPSHKYAVIISGGYNKINNHPRYWNDISFMYKVLKNNYGYKPSNIYVLAADGTDPAVDRSDGISSPTDLDGDGEPDIGYAATKANISAVFDKLARKMTADDFLFVFTTDHGGQDESNPNMGTMYLWDDYINAADFAVEVNKITSYDTMVFAMEQCYSGGFKDYLSGPNRVFMSAAAWDQVSYAMGPNYKYDEFSYYLTCALAGARPDGGFVNADQDGDGVPSFAEAYAFAKSNDSADETPQFDDQSALSSDPSMGAYVISPDGRFGTAFTFGDASELVRYSIDASFGTRLQVYVKDAGTPGDRWRVSLGNQPSMKATASGSILNWFSPAVALSFVRPKTATVSYTSGSSVFPAGGYIKFVLHGGKNKKMAVGYTQ
ncbi:MAG: C13 family peptidase [Syntrophobacter sp.]